MKTLRPYQSRLIRLLANELGKGERKVALISPTGSGKSLMVTTLLQRTYESGLFNGAVVAVPQTHIKRSFGFAGKVVDDGDGETKTRRRATITTETCTVDLHTRTTAHLAHHLFTEVGRFAYVCTHATMASESARKMIKCADLSKWLLVIDEGHRSTEDKDANRLSQVRDAWLAAGGSVLLVTATPYRTDGTPVIDDEWFRVQRSIADQCAEGYAPEHLECRHRPVAAKAKTRKEYEDGGKMSSAVVKAIIKDWSKTDADAKGNRPKAIVIVPQMDSRAWTRALAKAFSKAGARVFDATGVNSRKKAEVLAVLESEGEVTRWADSQIDVMIGCKRFDEGTDWPLCSHVYVIGYPVSINTTVQRWGRATRSKAEIKGHPFAGVASITFYVHAWSKALEKDLAKNGRLSLHRETSHLIAAHLHDWETSQQYAKACRGIWDAARRGPRKQRGTVDTIEQSVAMDESVRAQAQRDIDQAVAKLGLDPCGVMRKAEIEAIKNEVTRRHGEDRSDVVSQHFLERSKPSKAKDKAIGDVIREAQIAGQAQSLVRREMRAKFRAIVESLDLEYHDPAASKRLGDVSRWNGEQVRELAERLAAEHVHGDAFYSAVLAGSELYLDQIGQRPNNGSGDSYRYTGMRLTWGGISQRIRKEGRYRSLAAMLNAADIGDGPERMLSLEIVESRFLKHYNATQTPPTQREFPAEFRYCWKHGHSVEDLSRKLFGITSRQYGHVKRHKDRLSQASVGSLAWHAGHSLLTVNDLAKKAGVSKASLSGWLNGHHLPRRKQKQAIAAALGLTPEQIKWGVK